MNHSSKAIEAVISGSYYDRIVGWLRHGDKAPLSVEDKEIFDRIEWCKDQWLHYKEDRMVVKLAMTEYKVSQAQAYKYLNDAKSIYVLFVKVNYLTELLIEKERLERLLAKAENDPKSVYAKAADKLVAQKLEVLRMIREEQERMNPDAEKEIHFHFHTDWTKLPGVTPELMEEWNREFDIYEAKARKKFKAEEVHDVEFIN